MHQPSVISSRAMATFFNVPLSSQSVFFISKSAVFGDSAATDTIFIMSVTFTKHKNTTVIT